ncbi:hypothetical protein ASPZODRAFT_979287 [Penicilliopsis zonata CBS 506.65]|uniref:GPI anchored serine-threonine rich protein n=1 Tax=Penicilliopsis zonata CBS 506.65 TaxID=1073090 RepID=A0A1L9SQT5_9EURO|nr:hypothetical protein ASPZODRAFT_979287 [Penicilliopsis zonata CBS 506.65]OJJ49592.1 hypothetical protein ASPZODRAFT_979287 [Penicilliopsis zonata CBS 506.65]
MRYFTSTLAILAISAGFAAADVSSAAVASVPTTVTTTGYKCAAQNILDSCLVTEKNQLATCEPNDWKCLCTQSNNVLTCYNNCPNHPDQFGAEQTTDSYCNAAKAAGDFSSTTAEAPTSTVSSDSSSKTSGSTATTTGSADSSSDSSSDKDDSSSSSSATKSVSGFSAATSQGAAPGLAIDTGSLLAVMLLGLGAVL